MLNDTLSTIGKGFDNFRAAVKAVKTMEAVQALIGTERTAKAITYAKTCPDTTQEILLDCRGRWVLGKPMPWEK